MKADECEGPEELYDLCMKLEVENEELESDLAMEGKNRYSMYYGQDVFGWILRISEIINGERLKIKDVNLNSMTSLMHNTYNKLKEIKVDIPEEVCDQCEGTGALTYHMNGGDVSRNCHKRKGKEQEIFPDKPCYMNKCFGCGRTFFGSKNDPTCLKCAYDRIQELSSQLEKTIICPMCKGTGRLSPFVDVYCDCSICKGVGSFSVDNPIEVINRLLDELKKERSMNTCVDCLGSGRVGSNAVCVFGIWKREYVTCEKCNGKGRL